MTKFYLKIKGNDKDVICRTLAESYQDAVEYFSKLKKLSKKSLLEIYFVAQEPV